MWLLRASVPTGRGRWAVSGLLTSALIGLAVFIPSIAQAAVPANDDVGAATAVGSLPSGDTLDTRGATAAADDPYCALSTHTVWYAYTPPANLRVDANTFGSSYDTTISAYTGSPGALTQIDCNDDAQGAQSQVIFDVTAGQTYYIMVGAFDSSAGGDLTLTLRQAPPPPPAPVVRLSIDRGASLDRSATATVSGRVTCNQPLYVSLSGSLTQAVGRHRTAEGHGDDGVFCTPPGVPWTMTMAASGNQYSHGPAQADIGASACNSDGCTLDLSSARVTLRAGHPK